MIEIFEGIWTLEHVSNNTDKIFVFNDNNARLGKYDLSIIRDLKNSIGLRTKKGPSKKVAGYFSDSEYDKNIKNINEDILSIKSLALQGKKVVFSKTGYDIELKVFKIEAPKTFKYLSESLKNHLCFDIENKKIWRKVPGYDDISRGIYISLDKKKLINSDDIIQPYNSGYFKPELVSKNLQTIQDLIKTDNKIAFTQNKIYKKDSIIIFSDIETTTYYICRVVDDSYSLEGFDREKWRHFEGFSKEYVDSLNIFKQGYYQTHFQFVSIMDRYGNITPRSDIFDIGETSKLNIIEEKPFMKENTNNIEQDFINIDKNELIEVINKLNEEIENLKLPIYKKIYKYIKNKLRPKSFNQILEKIGLKGDILLIDNIHNKNKNKVYYKLVTDKHTYFLVFHKGVFKNKVYIILLLDND
jgi:hypothetical protein